jgi:apolipoprotein N-acyltransferase
VASAEPKPSEGVSYRGGKPNVGGIDADVLQLPTWLAVFGVVVSSVLSWLAYAGTDIWPLSFVAFVPLLLALRGSSPKRAFRLGLLAGTVMNFLGFYWLLTMLKTFSGFPWILCGLFALIVCAYQGGRMALTAWLAARAEARAWSYSIAFLLAFATGELVYPVLFPWYFAAMMHKVPLMTQTADLGGPILVSVGILGSSLAIAEVLYAKRNKLPLQPRLIAGFAALPALTMVYSGIRIVQVDARAQASPAVHAGLVQGNLGLMEKRVNAAKGLQRHRELTSDLKKKGVELVVWSESSVAMAVPEDIYKQVLKDRVSAQLGVPTIFGAVLYRIDPDRERWFNTSLSTNAKGDILGRYDKHFLLMFGEYLPLGDTFPILYKWSPNSGKFTQGTAVVPLPVEIRGETHKITNLVCYEDILPGFTNDAVRAANPEMLANITNDAWFGDTTEPWEHLALAKFRSIEHRRYMLRSTNSGVSAIIDPVGRTIAETKTFEIATANAIVHWMQGSTVYEWLGDKPWYALALVSFLMSRRTRKQGLLPFRPAT